MKNLKKLLLLLIIIPCALLFSACSFLEFGSKKVYVTDIQQTETVGNTTTYTVYYSDGSTSLFTVKNGEDGKDLKIEDIYNKYLEDHPTATYNEFLQEYLTILQQNNTIKDATNVAIQSGVSVLCEFPTYIDYTKDVLIGCGAGIIYKMYEDYSYIITNYHVVYYNECNTENNIAQKITLFQYGTSELRYNTGTTKNGYPVIGYGNGAITAEYVGGSLSYDIAVLKVPTSELKKYNPHAKATTVANGYGLSETAIAIGNPESEGFSVTSGIISVVSEEIEMTGADDITPCSFRVMRIDTAVNSGNSGGGLFNINGELIGIVNAKLNDSENIAYALPYDNVTKVADNLIYYYETTNSPSQVKKLILNIVVKTQNSRSIYNPTLNEIKIVEDVVVDSVSYNAGKGVGHKMGLRAGDIIKSVSINGIVYNISRTHEFLELLLAVREGDQFIINVTRNGALKELGFTTNEGVLASYLTIEK